jgi:hypothetical protein
MHGDDVGVPTLVIVMLSNISVLCRFFGNLSLHDPGDHISFRLSMTDRGAPSFEEGFRVLLDGNAVSDAGILGTGVVRCSACVGVGADFFFDGNLSLHDPGDHVSFRLSMTDWGGPGLKNGFRILLDENDVSDAGVFGTGVEWCSAGAGVGGKFLSSGTDETGADVFGTGVERSSGGAGAWGASFFLVFWAF